MTGSTNDALFSQIAAEFAALAESEQAAFLAAWASRPEKGSGPGDTSEGGGGPGDYSTWADIAAMLGPITWSWRGWLPDGLLTIVAAEPGVGKSALCLRIAQTLSLIHISEPTRPY